MENILKTEVSPQARGTAGDNYQSNIYAFGSLLDNPLSSEKK